ncbi:site-specific integrase, partial [Streptosporangium sp. NPDC020072]|uniref:site-specific integrase n=1 Tax=Streptosporangium sp. NPDC020072 TaxID=3154788 RepID=UPI0034195B02
MGVTDDFPAPIEVVAGEIVSPEGAALDRLAALDEAAERHDPRPANTLRSYASDWRAWEQFVTEVGIPLEAATVGSFGAFVAWLARDGKAPSTIGRRVAGVTVTLRER